MMALFSALPPWKSSAPVLYFPTLLASSFPPGADDADVADGSNGQGHSSLLVSYFIVTPWDPIAC